MPRPKRHTATAPSPYTYTGYLDADNVRVAPHVQCEEEGNHRVSPRIWPPPRIGVTAGEPSLALRCDLCGAHLVVYEGHATGAMPGVDVVVPTAAPDVARAKPGPKPKGLQATA